MSGTLYMVGTPIGNLGDFSPRAVEILSKVDFIAAEDTRVSVKLLNHFGIKKPLISYYEQNKYQRGDIILDRIEQGESCAQVSDAGMPAISDPGELLVKQASARGIRVCAVPGPCAAVTALALSGLPTGRFCFEGFLSVNKKSRREHLQEVKNEQRTLIFYEAPHKLINTLKDMYAEFGERPVALVKELTKIHEDVLRTTLSDAIDFYTENSPKGEYVIILGGADKPKIEICDLNKASQMVSDLIKRNISTMDAVKQVAKETGLRKNELYHYVAEKQE